MGAILKIQRKTVYQKSGTQEALNKCSITFPPALPVLLGSDLCGFISLVQGFLFFASVCSVKCISALKGCARAHTGIHWGCVFKTFLLTGTMIKMLKTAVWKSSGIDRDYQSRKGF